MRMIEIACNRVSIMIKQDTDINEEDDNVQAIGLTKTTTKTMMRFKHLV